MTNGVIFTGDTLFSNAVGRTDLSYSSASDLQKSLKKLKSPCSPYSAPCPLTIYPGHGPSTTVGHEKVFNPFVRA